VAVAVGFALAWMAVPTVGKRVFLLSVSAIPTVMPCMTTASATVKKSALGRKKSPPLAVKKRLLIECLFTAHQKTPSQPSSSDWSSFLLCLRWFDGTPFPWGRSGWGLQMDGAHPWQLLQSCCCLRRADCGVNPLMDTSIIG